MTAVAPASTGLDASRERTALPISLSLATTIGLPLLIVVMYTDVSDFLMRTLPVPSLLQPLIAILAIVVWHWRTRLRPLEAALQPPVVAFVLYGAVVFATSIWASDAGLVDDRVSEIVKATFLCILTASLAISWPALRRGLAALVVSAAVLAAISVVQITTGDHADVLGGFVAPQSGTIYGHIQMPRAAGPPNSDPNFYGRMLLMVLPTAIGLATAARTPARRIGYAAAAALITAGTLLTYSRGAMLSLAGMGLLLVIGLRLPAKRIGLLAAVALAGALLLPGTISRRIMTIETLMPSHDTTVTYDSAVEKRKLLVRSGIAMFQAHPWTGVGAGHYGRHYTAYANEVGSSWTDYHVPGTIEHPHGLAFEIASETGLPGLVTFGAAVAAVLLSLRRSHRAFLAQDNARMAMITLTVGVSILGYLMASVVLHETHLRYLALYFGFALALGRLSRTAFIGAES